MMKKKRKKQVKSGGWKLYLKAKSGNYASADWVVREKYTPGSEQICFG
jgi:hypothetical protein